MASTEPALARSLQNSARTCRLLGCTEDGPGGRAAITPRGRLFNELDFDPRLSSFVLSVCEAGGSTREAQEAAVQMVRQPPSPSDASLMLSPPVLR